MPSQFKCSTCAKTFLYSAKLISNISLSDKDGDKVFDAIETQVCPYCKSLEFALVEEQKPIAEEVAHVYVVDLHTGEKHGDRCVVGEGLGNCGSLPQDRCVVGEGLGNCGSLPQNLTRWSCRSSSR